MEKKVDEDLIIASNYRKKLYKQVKDFKRIFPGANMNWQIFPIILNPKDK